MSVPKGEFSKLPSGLTLHYHRVGEGTPVMFIHGSGPGGSGYSNFKGNYLALAEGGYDVLVPDLPGYGYSDKPLEAEFHLNYMVDALAELAEQLELGPMALIGNSMGGAAAILFASRFPEKVSRLVLMAPGGLESRDTYMQMRGIRRMMKAIYSPDGITLESMRKVFELQVYDPASVSAEIIEERFAMALEQPRRVFETMNVPSQLEALSQLKVPVYGFWGMNDQFCPVSGATTLATECPDVRVTLVGRCGHWVMVEHEDWFNRTCLDFLNEGRP